MSTSTAPHLRPSFSSPPARGLSEPSDPVPLSLFGFECSLDHVSLDTLEGVTRTVTREIIQRGYDRSAGTQEVALLSTCHRVELVVLAPGSQEREWWQEVLPGPRNFWRIREGREVVTHLFRVAAGLESLATGETEVSSQVQKAGRSVLSRHPRPILREAFQGAASVATDLATHGPARASIAAIGVARLRELMARPSPRVLVVGSGTVGREVVRCLAPFAKTTLLFHAHPPDPAFLTATGAEAAPLERLRAELATADAVVTAAKFGDRGLRAGDLPRDHPLLLLDLGMPRNVDPAVRGLPNVRLIDLEELHGSSKPAAATPLPPGRVEELARRFYDDLETLLWEPWVNAVLRAAETTRRTELAVARPFLGQLTPEQEAAIERLTRRLVSRLVLPPVERIRSLPRNPAGDRIRRDALELLRPRDSDP